MDFSPWFPPEGAWRIALAAAGAILLAGCHVAPVTAPPVPRGGDEIVVAGKRFPIGTRVVTWTEADGYNAYAGRVFPPRQSSELKPEGVARINARGWDIATLQSVVDQLVLHYDALGLSRICFDMLRKPPGLSAHFLLDVDGTLYQTLDLQERAAHATVSNSRSIGIEIANVGAYPPHETDVLDAWYRRDAWGTVIVVPEKVGQSGIRTRDFLGRPVRPAPVRGRVQGKDLVQYDFTPEQYAALAKLTAALCRVFPRIVCDVPRDEAGQVLQRKLPDDQLAKYRGILGHYHIQENKTDPGPAFQWEKFLDETRQLRRVSAIEGGETPWLRR